MRFPPAGYPPLNSQLLQIDVVDPLHRLTRRVRWKRWLGKLNRFVWLLAVTFFLLFVADWFIGMRTLSLRVASGITVFLAVALFAIDAITAWLVRLDRVGLAHLLEKRYPELAERLVTLVQLETGEASSSFVPLLRAETQQRLTDVDPTEACPLGSERRTWLRTVGFLAILFVGLSFIPAFAPFTQRLFSVWTTLLVPFTIEVAQGNGYALRGGSYLIEAKVRRLDEQVDTPAERELVCEDEAGSMTSIPMQSVSNSTFTLQLENLRQPLRCQVKAGEVVSAWFDVRLIDAPVFVVKPGMLVTPPKYAGNLPLAIRFEEESGEKVAILQFSKMQFRWTLDQLPRAAWLRIFASDDDKAAAWILPVRWQHGTGAGVVDEIAASVGSYRAELLLELDHGLSTVLPVGNWVVYEDGAPRFTQALHMRGGDSALVANKEYRIAPDDALKLQTVIEDDEGLDTISIEYRINDNPSHIQKWLDAAGAKKIVIDDWLPLPSALKETDRVQFRLHARDSRRLKKGEVVQKKYFVVPVFVPGEDLTPHVTIAPSAGENEWITLRVDRTIEGFLKQQVQAQGDEVREVIAKIKQKVQSETEQVQQVQRVIHQQSALTPAQMKQAEQLRALNREIAEDLLAAGERFGTNPELAKLAEHFLDIAETEMMKSAAALQRFSEKDRPLAEAEMELQSAQDALLQAGKKLERLLDWNKLLGQDRLDQFQLEKLAKRQGELAKRLEALLANEPKDDSELAKQIEAVRQEQAKIAEQSEQMQEQNRLVQESLESLQQKRAQHLAKEAQQLAAEQRAMRDQGPDKLSPELKARLDKLAQRQAELAQRSQPFAKKNEGPDVKPAEAAAIALKKPQIDDAIQQQKEHEKRLQEWVAKLLPGVASNALREQVLQLAKKQQAIRHDLERLGAEVDRLEFSVMQKRLADLTARQKEMPAAIARLPVEGLEERILVAKNAVEQTTKQAGDQMARENASGVPTAFELMKKAQQELEALANRMPTTLPTERKDIKDDALRAKVDGVEQLKKEQKKLRAETEQLQSEAMKASAGNGKSPLGEKTEKLASELMELAQKSTNPEIKAMAKESAQTVEAAKKAMEASQQMKAKGEAEQAKMLDEEAAKKLDLAVKQMAKFTQDQAMKGGAKENAEKTAEALKEGSMQMRQAEAKLPALPKDAQSAMQSASKSLQQAANQAGKLSANKLPNAARNPAAMGSNNKGDFPASRPKEMKLEALQGKAWGELPGELKTQMLQDVRARFGEDYAETIRQYFESLTETPRVILPLNEPRP